MAFYTEEQLKSLGFKHLGKNVKISDKASIYNPECISIGDYSRIDDFCVLSGNITIGRNVHIAVFCNLAGGEKGITMEDFSGFAYGVQAFSQSDDYRGRSMTNPTVPAKFKREKKLPILVKRHVIVGTYSCIMPGVTLEEGCSVGAMSFVNKSTEPWKIYRGNPAEIIGVKLDKLLELEKQFLEEESQNNKEI